MGSEPPVGGIAQCTPPRKGSVPKEREASPFPGPTPVFVGFDDAGNLLGFGLCGPPRKTPRSFAGEFYAINVLRRAHGLRLGRALMAAMAGAMLTEGVRPAALWVLRDNLRARQFYQRLGGRQVGEALREFGGAGLVEIAYGWDDIGPIAGGSSL